MNTILVSGNSLSFGMVESAVISHESQNSNGVQDHPLKNHRPCTPGSGHV